jgi:RNA polymerase sigma factor (sigma-70 family)
VANRAVSRDATGSSFVVMFMVLVALALDSGSLLAFAGGSRPAPGLQSTHGDVATFADVYETCYRDVYRYVLLADRRPEDADDLVQDVFDRAFAAWRDGRGPAGRPLPWLLVIARRLLVDRWRRRRLIAWLPLRGRHPLDDAEADAPEPGGADRLAEEREFWLWLDALSKSLPARQRELLFLRYQRDLSDEEVGEVLGLSPSGVRSLAARAIAALRQHPELWS